LGSDVCVATITELLSNLLQFHNDFLSVIQNLEALLHGDNTLQRQQLDKLNTDNKNFIKPYLDKTVDFQRTTLEKITSINKKLDGLSVTILGQPIQVVGI
jgi:hypothetical protein